MIKEVTDRVKANMDIEMTITDAALKEIAKEGYDTSYGARPLRRAIQNKIEDKLAEEVLKGQVREKDVVEIDFEQNDQNFVIKKLT